MAFGLDIGVALANAGLKPLVENLQRAEAVFNQTTQLTENYLIAALRGADGTAAGRDVRTRAALASPDMAQQIADALGGNAHLPNLVKDSGGRGIA